MPKSRHSTGQFTPSELCRYFTFIGHLAILVANSWRLLQTIGWQHAEPVLCYVVTGLTGAKGSNPDLQHFPQNMARVEQGVKMLPADWAACDSDRAYSRELLVLIREQNRTMRAI